MSRPINRSFDDLSRKRLAVYAFPPPDLANLIRAKVDLVFDSNVLLGDTRDIVGGAALYPPHITIKGPFRLVGEHDLDKVESAIHLIKSLEKLAARMPALKIGTVGLDNYPRDTLSIVFDHSSVLKLRELQALIVAIVDKVRSPTVEPNYQEAAKSSTLLNHGEPNMGDDYVPHISIVGGKPGGLSPDQIEPVRQLLGETWCRDWAFEVERVGLLSEDRFNGCWGVDEYYPLRRT